MSGPGPFEHPAGGEDDHTGLTHVEHRLRHALHHEASQVRPSERLDHILAASRHAGGQDDERPGRRRWFAPLAAAAAVAAIAVAVWGGTRPDAADRGPAAAPSTVAQGPSASPSTAPEPTATTGPSSEPSASPSASPATRRAALPAYFVGPVGGDRPVFRLFREFLPASLPVEATDAQKATAALALAMNAQPFSNTDGYLQPWSGTTVDGVTVTPDLITVTLSGPGSPGIEDRDVARVAVQSLVWTAQAAVGKGTIPVTFRVADGSTALFGTFPAAQRYDRPPSSESYQDLAPIWVTAPARDAALPAGRPVTVKGEATVFEATVSWELLRGGTVLKSGHATASTGAPGRGTYSFSLGALPPAGYTIRVFEPSMEDGRTINAERRVSFSVTQPGG
jgi:hypothetical protein